MALHPLTIELVPRTAWYSNLRSELTKGEWDTVRKATYQAAGYKCEICGGKGEKWPVECHEKWEYDDSEKIQTLLGLIALCPTCHRVKHAGLATIHGKKADVIAQLVRVNNWPIQQARVYIEQSFARWVERCNYHWEQDTTWLERNYGITIKAKSQPPPPPGE